MARPARKRSDAEKGTDESLHTVRKGQSLWDIAAIHYGLSSKWQLIYERNRNQIGTKPDEIEVGMKLVIPSLAPPVDEPVDGRFDRVVKNAAAHLEGRKILQLPTTMLLGMSENAGQILDKELKIRTIFDLAQARLFNAVHDLIDASSIVASESVKHGFVPGDIIRGDPSAIDNLEHLLSASLEELNFKNEDDQSNRKTANAIQAALSIDNVRDLGNWPPFLAARGILSGTFNPLGVKDDDPEAPTDLIPQTGNYATERVRYSSVVMTDRGGGNDSNSSARKELTAGALVDLAPKPIASDSHPFATGVMITNEQSWYAKGVTLGQLTHSLALAPGESTKIAVIDWTRRTSGREDQSTDQKESLSQSTEETRAISEITDALARESQHGRSRTTSRSASAEAGIGGGLAGLFGASAGGGTNSGVSTNVSHSSGTRHLAAEMTQNIQSQTEQLATSARSRRASVVRETIETESEEITTRVITNYNHMHALSIQYYEVVQVYRVVTKPVRFDRVLFIPAEPVRFTDPNQITRNKAILTRAALNTSIREAIANYEPPSAASLITFENRIAPEQAGRKSLDRLQDNAEDSELVQGNDMRISRIEYKCHDQAEIAGIDINYTYSDSTGRRDVSTGAENEGELDLAQLPVSAFSDLALRLPPEKDKWGPVTLVFHISSPSWSSNSRAIRHYVNITQSGTNDPIDIVSISQTTTSSGKVEQHLSDNALYYSQWIWATLDTATLRTALSNYTMDGKPVIESIDLTPVAITGNYMGFRWNFEEESQHDTWMEESGYSLSAAPQESVVPLPTDGVFAEAVLGRFNSAEKLDMSRFWNWQDSPIPILPPGLEPIKSGSRAEASDLKGGGLAQPAVQIVQPASMPDPSGMQSALQSLTASNIFRDMSGMAGAASALQTSLQASSAGASHASEEATKAFEAANKHQQEMTKLAMEAGAQLLPMMAGPAGIGASSVSKAGAVMNMAQKLDTSKEANSGQSTSSNSGSSGTAAMSAFGALIGRVASAKK